MLLQLGIIGYSSERLEEVDLFLGRVIQFFIKRTIQPEHCYGVIVGGHCGWVGGGRGEGGKSDAGDRLDDGTRYFLLSIGREINLSLMQTLANSTNCEVSDCCLVRCQI
jgi:hypothetical protein